MSSTYQGDALDIMIYGESHSETIGVYINGLPEDVIPDTAKTAAFMARRAPGKNAWSTPRKEADEVIFERNGAMLHGYIVNTNTKPKDYSSIMNCPRPSHADYAATLLYGDEASKSGGGIFSGRMTAPLCIAGSIALQELNKRGVQISAHLKKVAGVSDDSYFDHGVNDEGFRNRLAVVENKNFPVVDDSKGDLMKAKIEGVKEALKDVKNHPSVYYVVGFGEGGDWTATGETFINNIIELAGAENAAKSATGWAYNAEDLVKQDPNIIIIPAWADGTFQTTAPYKDLTAVKEGHVIVLESTDMFDRQCARNADAVEMLAKLIFPECFEEEGQKAA